MHQTDRRGLSKRSKGGSPPEGITLDNFLMITAGQAGHPVPVKINYNKAFWSGLSWAAGEIYLTNLDPHVPLIIRCTTAEKSDVKLDCALYLITYDTKEER